LMQFVKFLAVGGAGTVLNLAIFWLGLRAQHNLTASTVV
jgi:putative flippase GtrA